MTSQIVKIVAVGLMLGAVSGMAEQPESEKIAVVNGKQSENEKTAVACAENWLGLVDEGKYGESFKEAAEYLRNAVKHEQWKQGMQAGRKPLGKIVSRKVKTTSFMTSVPGAPDGEYVVIEFETSFEKKAKAIEMVTPMMEKDGKWRVAGYTIN